MESKTFSEKEKKEFGAYSFARAIRLFSEHKKVDGLEGEMHQEGVREFKNLGKPVIGLAIPSIVLNQRANTGQNLTTAEDGGNLIQEDPFIFIHALRNALVLQRMGARFLPGLVGNVPLIGGGSFSGEWVAEGDSVSLEKEAITKATLTPKNYRILGAISTALMRQTNDIVEMIIREQLIRALSDGLEAAAINGAGAPAPVGILGTAGIGSVSSGENGAVPTWENIVDLEAMILSANGPIVDLEEMILSANGLEGISYLTNSKVVAKLKKTLKLAGVSGYILDGNMMNGANVFCTNNVPSNLVKGTSGEVCSAIIAGNFSEMFIGMWGGLDLLVDPYTLWESGEIRFVMNQYVDVAVRNAGSFSAMLDAKT